MNILGQSPLLLATVAALFYGLGGPVMKLACNHGATPCGISLMYGGAAVVLSLNYWGSTVLFSTPKGLWYSALTGILFGIALVALTKAATLPTGYISVIAVVVATYPLISNLIGLLFLGEAAHTNVSRLIVGACVVVLGLYLVGTSSQNTH